MTDDTLLLIGRGTARAQRTLETHADRLRRRGLDVEVVTYEHEPVRELRNELPDIEGDRVFALPMRAAHSHETIEDIPAALSYVPGEIRYCEPVGRSPAVTDVLISRGEARVPADDDAALVLVGFGSGSKPQSRRTTEYHATRIREGSDYGEVVTCYLLQNPAVECARYNVSTDRAVAVPLFVTANAATEEQIPAKLELDRGGIAYADPLGEHERVTDAVRGEFERQRALAERDIPPAGVTIGDRQPVATDGEG